MVLLHIFLALVILSACDSFNFDLDFVNLINIRNSDTYFGYSLLLQKGTESNLIVGAPHSNSSYSSHASLAEPGAVYKCEIGISGSCQELVIENVGNFEERFIDNRFNYKDNKHFGLLGASVDGGDDVDDPLYVCSPRWKNDRSDRYGQHYLANGMCFGLSNSLNVTAEGERYMPLLNAGKQGYTLDGVVKYYFAMGELGTSMHFIKNEKKLLLGAPGVLGWRGTVVELAFKDLVITPHAKQSPPRDNMNSFNTPNPVYISVLDEDNLYLGYSVSSGRFVKSYRDLWYISGSPRAANLTGMVLLFEFPLAANSDLQIRRKLLGEQFGSYFGGSVLGVAISSIASERSVADLLVGAPTYSLDTWDEGCVYYYKNDGEGKFDNPKKIFGSKRIGARFGTALSAIGDINKDGHEDVAISAPYEEETGAVYIYLGSKNGLNDYSQRILGKSITPSLRGFGFSISKGIDIDNNLYNDIAIGAYKSGDVAIVKSRPIIKYFANITSSVKELLVTTQSFSIYYCLNYTTISELVTEVNTTVKISKDTRAKNNEDAINVITLTLHNNSCDDLRILVQEGNFDYTKPFAVEISYALDHPALLEFCPNCPVLDPNDSNFTTLNIPFANGCGSDHICRPDLNLKVNVNSNSSSLTIGQLTSLRLNVQISNNGEPAYLTKLFLTMPEDVDIIQIPSKCDLDDNRMYECFISNVLQPSTMNELNFEFDIKKINPKDQILFFNLSAESRGEEANIEDNIALVTIPLLIQNEVEISGISFPDSIFFVNESNQVIAETVTFTQEYVFKNLGPSPLADIVANFSFPVEIEDESLNKKIAFEVFTPEVTINNQEVTCTTDYYLGFRTNEVTGGESTEIDENDSEEKNRFRRNVNVEEFNSADVFDLPLNRTILVNCESNNVTCMRVTCSSSEVLNRNQFMIAKFVFRAHLNVLTEFTGEKDIILFLSTAKSEGQSKITSYRVPTLLIGSIKKSNFSYWFYVGGVFAAFVILCIIVLILYRLNFFSRPVRERLQNEAEEESEAKDLKIENFSDEEQIS